MTVWYVFSRFPAPSETFAGTDLRALRRLGVAVRAVNLRPAHPRAAELLREWDLVGLEVDSVTPGKLLAGLGAMLRQPARLSWLLRVIFADNWRRPEQVFKSLLALPRVFQIHRQLAADPPEVLHLFWGHYAALLGLLVRRTHPEVVVTQFLGAYDLRTEYRTSIRLARVAHAVFTHARANVAVLARTGVDAARVRVVYRGMDLERFQYDGRPKTPGRVAAAGRLVADKGMAEVLEAFARVQRELPSASLCLIGDGPERAALERRARALGLRGVEFTGYLPHREVFERLCAAEVFLFLSWSEHLPNVVKEAMAARCACVVSRTTGIEELVAPGQWGLVVEARDTEAAAAGVLHLLQAPDMREQFADRALAHLREHFDAQASMRRYREIWEACRTGSGGESRGVVQAAGTR
jgi:glycosyltransferase involved in cell wall biosynthesis